MQMDISALFIKIVFLVIPGIIAAKIYRKLRGGKKEKDIEYFIEILIFSAVSYLLCDIGIIILYKNGILQTSFSTFDAFFNSNSINGATILSATIISAFLAIFASYIYTYKLLNIFCSMIGATKRYGDQDVWTYLNNSPGVEWVYFRDYKHDFVYRGLVKAYSDSQERREILLEDVTVYRQSDSLELYSMEAIYISRDDTDFTIEIPRIANNTKSFKIYLYVLRILAILLVLLLLADQFFCIKDYHWIIFNIIIILLVAILFLIIQAICGKISTNEMNGKIKNGM